MATLRGCTSQEPQHWLNACTSTARPSAHREQHRQSAVHAPQCLRGHRAKVPPALHRLPPSWHPCSVPTDNSPHSSQRVSSHVVRSYHSPLKPSAASRVRRLLLLTRCLPLVPTRCLLLLTSRPCLSHLPGTPALDIPVYSTHVLAEMSLYQRRHLTTLHKATSPPTVHLPALPRFLSRTSC